MPCCSSHFVRPVVDHTRLSLRPIALLALAYGAASFDCARARLRILLSRRTKALTRLPRVIRPPCCLLYALDADLLAGIMLLASLASLIALTASTLAATHKISVGAYANGTQATVFDPATVKAAVGDSLERVDAAT